VWVCQLAPADRVSFAESVSPSQFGRAVRHCAVAFATAHPFCHCAVRRSRTKACAVIKLAAQCARLGQEVDPLIRARPGGWEGVGVRWGGSPSVLPGVVRWRRGLWPEVDGAQAFAGWCRIVEADDGELAWDGQSPFSGGNASAQGEWVAECEHGGGRGCRRQQSMRADSPLFDTADRALHDGYGRPTEPGSGHCGGGALQPTRGDAGRGGCLAEEVGKTGPVLGRKSGAQNGYAAMTEAQQVLHGSLRRLLFVDADEVEFVGGGGVRGGRVNDHCGKSAAADRIDQRIIADK